MDLHLLTENLVAQVAQVVTGKYLVSTSFSETHHRLNLLPSSRICQEAYPPAAEMLNNSDTSTDSFDDNPNNITCNCQVRSHTYTYVKHSIQSLAKGE